MRKQKLTLAESTIAIVIMVIVMSPIILPIGRMLISIVVVAFEIFLEYTPSMMLSVHNLIKVMYTSITIF